MTYLILVLGILFLVLLISYFKFNTFLSFVIVSILIGLANHMNVDKIAHSIETGVGNIVGQLVIIIAFGAMQGKVIVVSGAAQRITDSLIKIFGLKYLHFALLITGFIVGMPLFYSIGFILLVPLVITLAAQNKLPAVWLAFPMLSVLSSLHGFLPPHPSPVALTTQLGGDLGKTILVGSITAVAAIVCSGILYGRTLKDITVQPMQTLVAERMPEEKLPSTAASYISCFLPVILISISALLKNLLPHNENIFIILLESIGQPVIAMTISLLFSVFVLIGTKRTDIGSIMKKMESAVMDITSIIFVIAGAGALSQVLNDTGLTQTLSVDLSHFHASPLLVGFLVAMIIRLSIGSATVAGLTAVGIVKPLFLASHVAPELMVIAVGSGSLMFSHVNDAGFWMFKEYFNLSIKQTIRTWSIMETIVGLTGICVAFLLKFLFY